jgi:uncharacterized protein YecT (DUF1311 family)
MPETKACTAALFLILTLVPSALLAQGRPNCQNPQTQTDMNICAGLDYKAADAELNRAYKAAMAAMKDMDANLPPELKGGVKALRAAQRAWIPYRDKACEAYGFMARGGSMESMLVGTCLADLTRKRTGELKDLARGLAN